MRAKTLAAGTLGLLLALTWALLLISQRPRYGLAALLVVTPGDPLPARALAFASLLGAAAAAVLLVPVGVSSLAMLVAATKGTGALRGCAFAGFLAGGAVICLQAGLMVPLLGSGSFRVGSNVLAEVLGTAVSVVLSGLVAWLLRSADARPVGAGA